MPRTKETLRIEVDERTAGQVKTIAVTVTAPAQDFLFADMLKERGATTAVEVLLKQAVKEAVQTYLDGAEDLVAGIAGRRRQGNGNGTKTKGLAAQEAGANGAESAASGSVNGPEGGSAVHRVTGGLGAAAEDVLSLE